MTIFDIETSALPEEQLTELIPGFDPLSVKTGNIKDPDKIREKIEAAEKAYYEEARASAALSPVTGRVICVGYIKEAESPGIFKPEFIYDDDEVAMLKSFWDLYAVGDIMVGFNILLFDMPFLIKRSWHHGVKVPMVREGRYWSDNMLDLRDVWQIGDRQCHGSLETISKFFGLGGKAGNGADFGKLWEADRPKALEYVKRDLELTQAIARKMGVM